jgi:hypothetical protein
MPALRMLERKVDEKIVLWFKRTFPCPEGVVIKLSMAGAHGTAGWPDREFVAKGKAVFMEMKATGNEPTPLQHEKLAALRRAGMQATWTDDPAKGIAFLKEAFGV